MALEAVVFPQDPFGNSCKDFYSSGGRGGGVWSYGFGLQEEDKALVGILDNNKEQGLYGNWDSSSPSLMHHIKEWDPNSSPEAYTGLPMEPPAMTSGRRKRRRTKRCKNKEEVENQRMTHIAVERNRRKQMNDYLTVLRSLMPTSYVQRGDQASIIGGAINFVKEMEQMLQTLEAQKKTKQQADNAFASPLADFFSFPQYSTRAAHQCNNSPASANESTADKRLAIADIEVTMVESHANLKILSKKRPKQLLKMVAGFQSLGLSILHLSVTTVDQMVLYSLSVKVEDGCQLTTDEIAAAVNQMLRRIQEESMLN